MTTPRLACLAVLIAFILPGASAKAQELAKKPLLKSAPQVKVERPAKENSAEHKKAVKESSQPALTRPARLPELKQQLADAEQNLARVLANQADPKAIESAEQAVAEARQRLVAARGDMESAGQRTPIKSKTVSESPVKETPKKQAKAIGEASRKALPAKAGKAVGEAAGKETPAKARPAEGK